VFINAEDEKKEKEKKTFADFISYFGP